MRARMIGALCPKGPGGKRCACCAPPPGRGRRLQRRTTKRKDKRLWRRSMVEELTS